MAPKLHFGRNLVLGPKLYPGMPDKRPGQRRSPEQRRVQNARWRGVLALLIGGSTSAFTVAPCDAQEAPPDKATTNKPAPKAAAPATSAPEPESEHRLKWDFPRFRLWQYVAVGVQTAANLTIEFTDFPSRDETWRSTLPLDVEVRDALLPSTAAGIERADVVSDVFFWGTQFYTVVIDSLVVPLAFDNWNTDVALQMTMINWQALGLTGLITRAAHHSSGRARPEVYGCSEEPGAAFPCRKEGPGFFAGHVSMTSAGAGLACAHHAALPIYGDNPAPGTITCVVLVAGTVTTGIMRMMADRHWVSDVIVGHLVGGGVGFGLPWLLHYQHRITPKMTALGVKHSAWLPWATSDSVSLNLIGAF